MKHLKKLSILALLLTAAVQGAWAEGTLQVTEIKASDISAWDGDNTPVTAADLPGFKAVTLDEAKAWADAPASGMAVLYYDFNESGEVKYVAFQNGAYTQSFEQTISRIDVYSALGYMPTFYTSGASSEPSAQTVDVTPVTGTTNQWTLTMPAANVELQVEYEPEYSATFKALTANTIGTAATVKLDNVAIDTLTAEKNTLNGIYPGQTVTLTAQPGYKFRKVEAKEGDAAPALQSETITFSGGNDEEPNQTFSGTLFQVSGTGGSYYLRVDATNSMTISAKSGKTIVNVELSYNNKGEADKLSPSSGTFDGDSTVTGVNATSLTISSTSEDGTGFAGVTVYYAE